MKSLDTILYVKGGQATKEAARLFHRRGEILQGGPDNYLLVILKLATGHKLRLVSIGSESRYLQMGSDSAVEYCGRPIDASATAKVLAVFFAILRFSFDTLRLHPKKILCGIEGPFAVAAWLTAKILRSKFFYFSHCAPNLPTTSRLYKICNKFIVKHADAILANGPYLTEEALRLGANPEKLIEFNIGIDTDHKALLQALPEEESPPIVLFAGRLEINKGAVDLFNAFHQISSGRSCRLVYAGEGPAAKILGHLIAETSLQDRVEVRGILPHADVIRLMRAASVVVTPTQSTFPEGRCKTVMEAFFAGTPVIAPDYGPFPYLVRDGQNGLLYPADDVEELGAKLRTLLSDNALRSQLRSGAKQTGLTLMDPEVTFYKAAEQVFSQHS
jgi:glycosyltransferase involved in cell wall biosynthesis